MVDWNVMPQSAFSLKVAKYPEIGLWNSLEIVELKFHWFYLKYRCRQNTVKLYRSIPYSIEPRLHGWQGWDGLGWLFRKGLIGLIIITVRWLLLSLSKHKFVWDLILVLPGSNKEFRMWCLVRNASVGELNNASAVVHRRCLLKWSMFVEFSKGTLHAI